MAQYDVLIVGAGAAGLQALRTLRQAGLSAYCLEARNRVGGRIATLHRPDVALPIELGPEFIHGRPPQTWRHAREAGLSIYDCEENAVHLRDGKPLEPADSWDQVDAVNQEMVRRAESGPDIPFTDFLNGTEFPALIKQAATNYVEGFNAARSEEIGIASLARDAKAASEISGDYNFRIANGYDALPQFLAEGFRDEIGLNQVVERVEWEARRVRITTRSTLTGDRCQQTATRAILTLPLGVLQARQVQIEPEPLEHLRAADRLRFGQVMRFTFVFRESWWEEIGHLQDAGFWLSNEKTVPTWWTSLPFRVPLLVGWSSGPHADALLGRSREEQVAGAVADLSRLSGIKECRLREQMAACFFRDWSLDPFARGAYSYVPAGALDAQRRLAEPVEDTLFFAGEATELEGHAATVHGALATGERAAARILASHASEA